MQLLGKDDEPPERAVCAAFLILIRGGIEMAEQRLRVRFNGAAGPEVEFDLIYLHDFGHGSCNYLQFVRTNTLAGQGGENSGTAEEYWVALCPNRVQLRGFLGERPVHAILRAPSSKNLNCAFFAQFLRDYQGVHNLSANIKKGTVSAGAGAPFNELLADYTFVPDLPDVPAAAPVIVIVDDVFNTGKTMGAMIETLRPHLPEGTTYILACPLRVPMTAPGLHALSITHTVVAPN